MFVRQKQLENCIQKVRINIGKLVGLENDDECYIVLKELPTLEILKLKDAHDKGIEALMKYFKDVIPDILVEHNLYETEQQKMSNKAVAELIYDKSELTNKVISEYTNASFFTPTSKGDGNSVASAQTSSTNE